MKEYVDLNYDVALSFATPDQEEALLIYNALDQVGVATYYYADKQEENLGEELIASLRRIYSKVPIVLIFFSQHYSTPYTDVELAAALSGLAAEDGIMPYLLDTMELPDSLTGRVHWSLQKGTDKLVSSVRVKVAKRRRERLQILRKIINEFEDTYSEPTP